MLEHSFFEFKADRIQHNFRQAEHHNYSNAAYSVVDADPMVRPTWHLATWKGLETPAR
jgi:hypothetical protein